MSFRSKTYHTKFDQSILVREAVPQDAEQLLELKLQYLKNTSTIPLFDYEYPNDIVEEEKLIKRYRSQNNSLLLVAAHNNTLVGNIDLTGNTRKKMQHTAVIGMGVHTNYHNQGIGTLLLQHVSDWAQKNEILRLVWLEVYATNTSRIALYKKMGFKETGHIQGFFFENDNYLDKITMTKAVS